MSFTRTILETVTSLLPQPRVIRDRSDLSPYLSRWYLFGKPWMPDGSSPFDESGQTREGMQWSKNGLGVYLHKFHRDDESDELHNHPWRFSIALVLAGGYVEERRAEIFDPLDGHVSYVVEKRVVKPGTINVIRSSDFHRVDLVGEDSWSLFVTWRKASSWGFWDRHTNTYTPWRQYLEEWRAWQAIPFEEKLKRTQAAIDEVLEKHKFPEFPHLNLSVTGGDDHIETDLGKPVPAWARGGTLPREGEEDDGQVEKEGGRGKGPQEEG